MELDDSMWGILVGLGVAALGALGWLLKLRNSGKKAREVSATPSAAVHTLESEREVEDVERLNREAAEEREALEAVESLTDPDERSRALARLGNRRRR
jgi:hypothetical protein